MITTAEQTFEKLKNADIDYQLYQHPPVHTVEDANLYCQHISGAHVKNLCLCNKKKTFFCLLTVPDYKRVDLKNFAEQLMHSRFSFVNGNKLFELLGVYPGAVSPLCLLNDSQQQFHFFMLVVKLVQVNVAFLAL